MVHIVEYELRDGNRIPALGLGTWTLRGTQCTSIVKRALELGYTHIDTADMYGNHAAIGDAINGFDRSTLFLTSKVRPNNLRYGDVIKDCHRSLRELGTPYLDLFLIHWPNERIPLQETLRAFAELLDAGKIKSGGVSNYSIRQITHALTINKLLITNNQVRFHPYDHDQGLLEFCRSHDIVMTAYSPLGRARILDRPVIRELATQYQRTSAQICLRWGVQKGLVVIPKTSSEARLQENLKIFDWEITSHDMNTLDACNAH